MHELFASILAKKDLSRAGELFSVEDEEIVNCLTQVLLEISNIVSQPQYLSSINDQSVIEICVNRCTSCIRETNTAEQHCSGLVQLLEVCYSFNHKPSSRRRDDPPHAKLSSDLISCIFLNYNKKAVMEQALPIAVKFLDKENEEMSKNLAAYLSLAAIEYTNLLVPYVDIILRSLLNGNYSLSRVVLQMFDFGNERPIMLRTKSILDILGKCEASEKNIILQLIGNMINNMLSDDLNDVIDKLPQLFDLVLNTSSANQALIVLLRLAEKKPFAFHEYIDLFILTAQKFPSTICLIGQILSTVGKKNKDKAFIALEFIMENLNQVDRTSQTILLQEAVKLCSFYPILFNDKLTAAIRQHTNQKSNSQTQLLTPGNNITIVNLNSSTLIPLRTSQNQTVPSKPQQVSTTYINNHSMGNTSKTSPFSAPHYSRKQKIDSRSTGRLNNNHNNSIVSTNRSMTKLNSNNSNKTSMTRLSSSQHIHQSQSVASTNLLNNIDGSIATQPPPLSQHVTITGENKWGIPSIKSITSGGVTLQYNSPNKIRPFSMTANGFSALNQSTGSINNQNNVVYIQQNNNTYSNTTSTSISPPITTRESSHIDIISGTTSAQVSSRKNGSHNKSVTLLNINNNVNHRMSVFEPHMRDTIQHFCEKHLDKIKSYIKSVSNRLPPACKITIEERRSKKFAKIHFACQSRSNSHCLYSKTFFSMRTRFPKTWIHLMFLDLQSRVSHQALSSYDPSVSSLKHCWDTLKIENRTFITLVTSAFPVTRDQDSLINELRNSGFFDVFEIGPSLNLSNNSSISLVDDQQLRWACFLCNHPEKAMFLENNAQPVIEGQLKEKKGKWRLFKRWRTRYFTLSGAHLSCKNSNGNACTLDINQIRSVKVQRGARNIPTCFEIFAENQTLILKPTDGEKAEEWAQYLNIVLAKQRDGNRNKSNTLGSRREI